MNLSIASICPWKSTYARWLNAEISGHSSAARGSRRPNNIHNTTGHIHCLWHFLAIRTEIHWAWRANNNHFDGKSCFRSATVLHFAPFRSARQAGGGAPKRTTAAAGESEKDEERRPPPWRACCRPQSVLMAVTLIQFQHISWITAECMWLSIFFSAGNWHRGGGLRCVYSTQQQSSSSSSINSHHHRPDFLFFASFNASNWIDFSGWCLT